MDLAVRRGSRALTVAAGASYERTPDDLGAGRDLLRLPGGCDRALGDLRAREALNVRRVLRDLAWLAFGGLAGLLAAMLAVARGWV